MSTGVSSLEQLLIDFKFRGEADIDIPVMVLGIGLDAGEQREVDSLRELYRTHPKKAAAKLPIAKVYHGTPPGPK